MKDEKVVQFYNTGYGIDVAIMRADDIDKKMLSYISELNISKVPKVLDIGCGAGGQAVRMAQAGAQVLALDIHDFSTEFKLAREACNLSESQLLFAQEDVINIETLLKDDFDMCALQRVLHYIPYEKARLVLKTLRQQISDRLYLTVTGLSSDIGKYYACADSNIADRFCVLDKVGSGLFSIDKPMCLYTQTELENLLSECGWVVLESRVSAFGNIKVICT